ncbi:MAG: NAD(P)H-dependent oxidoreductase subunit E [Nitrospinota bacterium]|nr:MAG: NAD(P)H-dependent oxidoreductase subunit E [Nitrospinota bacterium]
MSSEVVFSTEGQERLAAILKRYPYKRAAILPVLHLAQEEFSYISPAVEEYVAQLLDLTPAQVHEVVTFYSMFRSRPLGKYHIECCTNLSCFLRGGLPLVKFLEEKLGIRVGEVTPDQQFSLATVECLCDCGSAPVVRINNRYYGNLSPQKLDALLEELKQQ